MFREFSEFIKRGDVITLAVGFVMGAAFGAIVSSLTDDILMPIVGIVLGGVDFSALAITVGEAVIQYGNFIQAIVNFIIIAFAMFLLVRAYNGLQREQEEAAAAAPPAEIVLLTEIRDLLRREERS